MIRLTIDMPRWVWWLALRFRLAIALEVEGELVRPLDLIQHGRPLTLIYGGSRTGSLVGGTAADLPALESIPSTT